MDHAFKLSDLPLQSQLDKFCGNPRGPNGAEVSRSWYAQNIVRIPAPWPLNMGDIRIRELTVHRKMAARASVMFGAIRDLAYVTANAENSVYEPVKGIHPDALDVLDNWGMTDYGGGYNYRVKRAGSTLSTHAYGMAFDFDPAHNGFRDATPRFSNFPKLCAIFREYGVWGGDWSEASRDGMHIQFARVK